MTRGSLLSFGASAFSYVLSKLERENHDDTQQANQNELYNHRTTRRSRDFVRP